MRCTATLLMVVVVVRAAREGPLVDTEDGRVSGILEKSVRGRAFHSFYGIPFAQPPLGKLRFKDPVTLPPWEGTRNASSHPAMCPQCIPDTVTGQHVLRGEEDCLYLNVFTPECTMGKKCWVVGCKTGYLTNKAVEQEQAAKGTPITLHKFPRDDELRARWLKNIKRDEKDDPSAERYCCSVHFKASDFKVTPTVQGGRQRQRKRLVEDAVPTNFSHSTAYPSCMQEAPPAPKRSTSMASSTARRSVQVVEAARMEQEFMDSDKFTSLEDLQEKIKTEIPRNYRISLDKDAIEQNRQFLTLFTYEPVLGVLPAMANVLRIGETGSFVMAKGGVKIANRKLRHILHGHRDVFTRVSQVINALAFLNNYSVEETDKVTMVVEAVEDIDVEALAAEQRNLLTLVKAQLLLSQKNKRQRRYSSDFLIKCAVLYRAGLKVYRLLNEEMGLILPSEKTVQRVTKSTTYRGGIDPETRALFQAFAGSLSKREKVLHLGIDEVHTLHSLQLFGGDLHGMTEDGEVAKVLLSVHAHSALGTFSEMVSMTPKVASTMDDVRVELDAAIKMLTEVGFDVHSVSFDGHATNAGYYASLELPEGTWSYTNPYADGSKQIFVYFDPVHVWKNIYSSFHNNGYMVLPRCPGAEEPERTRTARFSSLKALASWENYKSVKAGYKLTQKVLAPSSIEKQSVGLILAVVNPYTVAGLRLLAKTTGKEDHRDTADVLEMFQRMISVMNVRGQGQDVRWNDKYRCVLRPRAGGDEGGEGGVEDQAGRFDEQSEANIKFLQEIGEICKVREVNSLPVMVFIHGGAFFAGGAAGYRPHALLDHDVVLVVLQYRLGVLGFLSTEDSVMPGNLGLKDQTMALQWVQRNINHFGGDNTRITLFGESAGGASIHYQMLTPKAKGLFSRAILQSGTAMCPWAVNAKPREWAHQVADIVGCPADRGSEALLHCLQELDANVLALAHQKLWKWSTLPLTMVPWVDGEYLPAHPTKLVLEGRHAQVDIMSGVTRDEGALLALPAFSNKGSLEQLNNNFSEAGPITLELSTQHNEAEAVARQVYLHYLGTTHVTEAHAKELVRMFSDRYFGVCHDLATALHAANVHPAKKTFRYELDHLGELSYSQLLCPSCDGEWICHADDLLYLFYRGPFLTQPPGWPEDLERPEDLALRDIMTALWTNFAATGDPTPNDALGFKWEPSTADNLHYLSLTPSPSMKPDYRKKTREFYSSLLLPENLILHSHLVDGTAGEPKAAGDSSKTEL